jgi:hypothetical protein
MFQRIHEYGLIDAGGLTYRARAYAEPQPEGPWAGWLIFFPLLGGPAIAPPAPETTQRTAAALAVWAAGLSAVYLEGALTRALQVAGQPAVVDQLLDAEYAALDDAARLEIAAQTERVAANVDELAAEAARADAERIRRDRLEVAGELAALDEQAADVDAQLHEHAAREARAAASEARGRKRSAQSQAKSQAAARPRAKKR